jgi:hypothetical protein
MSGWHPADKYMEENVGSADFQAVNNITVYGQLPSDQVPSASKSTNPWCL